MTNIGTSAPQTDDWTVSGPILAAFVNYAPKSLTASAMFAYTNDVSGTSELRLGIYEDNAGSPGNLLAQTDNVLGGASVWVGGSLNSTVDIIGGSPYWLAMHSPNTVVLGRYQTGSGGSALSSSLITYTSGIMPPTHGGARSDVDWKILLYATNDVDPGGTVYTINGEAASLQPLSQKWRGIRIGTDHARREILSGNWAIDLSFQGANMANARQWMEAASSGSANINVLKQYSTEFTTLSGVYIDVQNYPAHTQAAAGPWSLTIVGASKNE